jgi:hypothetical protein
MGHHRTQRAIHDGHIAGRERASRPLVLVEVRPLPAGWQVSLASAFEPTLFLSGRRAEQEGRRMTLALTAAGLDARLHIHDRDQTLVGAYLRTAVSGVLSSYLGPAHGRPLGRAGRSAGRL